MLGGVGGRWVPCGRECGRGTYTRKLHIYLFIHNDEMRVFFFFFKVL